MVVLIPALMFSSCKDDDKSDGDPLLAPRNLVGLAGDGQVILNWDAHFERRGERVLRNLTRATAALR